MFKQFNDEDEWTIFNNVINTECCCKSRKERDLFARITNIEWHDNTRISRPDFIADDLMIEMFEIDDNVVKKNGRQNPQRKADARAERTVENFIKKIGLDREQMKIIAHGDTRYNPETDEIEPQESYLHHNYQAYVDNFTRICNKHINSIEDYRHNFPSKELGFLIVDDSTSYVDKATTTLKEAFHLFPFFDKNFMKLFIKADVDFIIWAFNNKYLYTKEGPHVQDHKLPDLFLISKDNYYSKYSRKFPIEKMQSLEE